MVVRRLDCARKALASVCSLVIWVSWRQGARVRQPYGGSTEMLVYTTGVGGDRCVDDEVSMCSGG